MDVEKKILREVFLSQRSEEIRRAKEDKDAIVVDPGEEIICDYCNSDIEEELIHLDGWGAVCPECRG